MGDEVGDDVVAGTAADQEALLAGGVGLLSDIHQVGEGVDVLGGVAGVSDQLLVVQHDGHVAEIGGQIDVIAHHADVRGGGDDIVIEAVTHLAEIGQHVVGGELSHPGAIHHAQVILALGVGGVQGDLAVQVVEAEVQHFALDVVLGLKGGKAGLDDVAVGTAAQDQGHLGGLGGAAGTAAGIAGGLFFSGLAAAAGDQGQSHDKSKDQR